ncbi:MAG TPA: hypothetical protein DEP48_03565 [Persephonella sp.]|uniref:Uncharacterized protein n=1 Tax=Persephonella marina (strain DSM 14350 / EX-H1) TaxID=123214 RepID=C0QSM5_PERMH|nr:MULTISPECIES: hypothetical protein [Persephonella]ACO03540.1 hypothetical protein PERMA_1910 [Persephonella marina EX-H1]HCB69418.1 hypothetical protein [Persephonella sp.]
MYSVRSIVKGGSFNDTVFETFREMLGDEKYNELKDFLDFYRIECRVDEKNRLVISIYFSYEKKWYDVAMVDLNDGSIKKFLTDREFISKINNENLYILSNLESEIKRTSTVILSIIAFLIGASIGIIILQIL